MLVVELDPEHRVGQQLGHRAAELDHVLLRHQYSVPGPSLVVNNLNQLSLLTSNPNFLNTANNAFFAGSGINPFRLDRSQAGTKGQTHDYRTNSSLTTRRSGLVPEVTGNNGQTGSEFGTPGLVMGYFDGNTVTGSVELRAELRDERQHVHGHVWSVDAGRNRRGIGSDQRRRVTANGAVSGSDANSSPTV